MSATPRRAIVQRLDQLRALQSPVRQELLDVLARVGAVSLRELGAALGRPADGLYYHVRALVRCGLVRPAGTRVRAGRPEALFRAIAPDFNLRYATSPPGRARAIESIVAGMMRLGIRDFRRAFAGADARFDGPQRDLWALRVVGWLTPRDLRGANRRIRELARSASRPAGRGRLYAITVLLTPLDHRARRPRGGRRAGARA